MSENNIIRVAKLLKKSRNLIVAAGAGMGVDSGLPDFRSKEGFWKAYPPYKKLNISFYEAANPSTFIDDPSFAWGFYGHRLNLYRSTEPHEGFYYIQEWVRSLSLNFFVITSNVDGQFQKSGIDEEHIYEIHGSIHYLQCIKPCRDEIWENNLEFSIDANTMRSDTIPKCPYCGNIARPNILMFCDFSWISKRSDYQARNFYSYLVNIPHKDTLILEIGAGKVYCTPKTGQAAKV